MGAASSQPPMAVLHEFYVQIMYLINWQSIKVFLISHSFASSQYNWQKR